VAADGAVSSGLSWQAYRISNPATSEPDVSSASGETPRVQNLIFRSNPDMLVPSPAVSRRPSCPTLPNIDQAAVKSLAFSLLWPHKSRDTWCGGSAVLESLGEKARTRGFATPAFAGCAYVMSPTDSDLQPN